jgi:hypothetical protein
MTFTLNVTQASQHAKWIGPLPTKTDDPEAA